MRPETDHSHQHLHLHGADDCAEQAKHAKEFHSAQVLHGVFLRHVGDGVQHRTEQHQAVT